jgi:hypothetical protein
MTTATQRSVHLAWAARADELAAWTEDHHVTRRDVWGAYLPLDKRGKELDQADGTKFKSDGPITLPGKAKRGTVFLTTDILAGHYRATRPEHIVGLHTTSPANLCKWGALEIDWHGPTSTAPAVNEAAALAWYNKARGLGFSPLLTDSNGKGGYHLRFFLSELTPASVVRSFLLWFTKDHQEHGLPSRPELFPKQDRIGEGKCGNWLRLPGLHHTRQVWATVWDGGAWVAGEEAVARILTITGSPPDRMLRYRINAYRETLPHGVEGTGRDNVAYQFLAFLVRDLAIPDEAAVGYAEEWDAGNSPPKGRERLREILKSVHAYGKNGYGSGLNGQHKANSNGSRKEPLPGSPPPPAEGCAIIREYLVQRYRPDFRRGNVIHCADGREVTMGEACSVPDSQLIDRLAGASNAPQFKGGGINRNALPTFFRTWARVAWGDILGQLPDEDQATLGDDSAAREEFRRLVGDVLLSEVVLGEVIGKSGATQTERCSLIEWCRKFGKPGPWRAIRSKRCWCRTLVLPDGEVRLQVAIRVELFAQMRADRRLCSMNANTFARRAERYGVGTSTREARPHGLSAVLLNAEFVADLLDELPGEESDPGDSSDR